MKRTILRTVLSLSAFLILLTSSTAYSHDFSQVIEEAQGEEKLYIQSEQIQITDQGIMIWSLDGKDYFLANNLSFDDLGLFIRQPPLEKGPCGLHTRWCKICGGCGVLFCPMNCTCFD